MVERTRNLPRRGMRLLALPLLAALGGCNAVVMNPAGDVAMQQRDLILIATGLMLLIIVPVIVLTLLFAWRYRATNEEATYSPDWDHSTVLELVIWSAPLLIIICLGAVTWVSTHTLDPYRLVGRIAPGKPVPANTRPLEVDVVALDWKFLFIYPEYGIATVNELAAPVGRPIQFKITASSVMNTFYVPTLAGMIYAMPGMETKLSAVLNRPTESIGFSGNYSGAGFSDMHFRFHGLDQAGFDRWVAQVKGSNRALDRGVYLQLEKPSENVRPIHFAGVAGDLYPAIVNMCVAPGKPCVADTMMADMKQARGAPVNDGAGPQHGGGRPEGALMRAPEDKGEAPHLSKPRDPNPPGNGGAGSPANRDMTFNTIPATRAGTPAVVRS